MYAKGTESEKRCRQAELAGSWGLFRNNNYGFEYKTIRLRRNRVKLGEACVLFVTAPLQIPQQILTPIAQCFLIQQNKFLISTGLSCVNTFLILFVLC